MIDFLLFCDAQLNKFYTEDNIGKQRFNSISVKRFIIMNGIFVKVELLTSIGEELYANFLIWHI